MRSALSSYSWRSRGVPSRRLSGVVVDRHGPQPICGWAASPARGPRRPSIPSFRRRRACSASWPGTRRPDALTTRHHGYGPAGAGQERAHRAGGAGSAGLQRDLAVGHDLAGLQRPQHPVDGLLPRRHSHVPCPTCRGPSPPPTSPPRRARSRRRATRSSRTPSSPTSLDELADELHRLEVDLGIVPAANDFEGTPDRAHLQPARARQGLRADPGAPERAARSSRACSTAGCLISSLSSIAICAGETPQPIHADDQLMPIPKPHPPTVCNTMWALTDFTEANGATRIIPGTHLADRSPDYGAPYDSIPAEMAAGLGARVARQPVARRRRQHHRRAPRRHRHELLRRLHPPAGEPAARHPARHRGRASTTRLQQLCGYSVYSGLDRPHRQARPDRAARTASAPTGWCGSDGHRRRSPTPTSASTRSRTRRRTGATRSTSTPGTRAPTRS